MNAPIRLPSGSRILIVALRRLGDVLLTTPLIRSVKRAWPDCAIDVLVFSDTAAILKGNPDIADVVAMPQRPSAGETFALAARLWRRYDLSIATQAGDRPAFFAIAAGKRRAGLFERRLIGVIKKWMMHYTMPMNEGVHRVDEVLTLASALGIEPTTELVAPRGAARPDIVPDRPYAVVHAAPMFRYKQWYPEGWRTVAKHLSEMGLAVLASGGPAEEERRYLDAIWHGIPFVQRIEGRLNWPELSTVLAGARVYAGPDTSVTHLAAASGCPTVALYGPTDARRWGPWPATGLDAEWRASDLIQTRGNVWIVQNPLPCLPCQHEGCLRQVGSYSRCLDELPVRQVLDAIDAAVAQDRRPVN